MTTIEEAKYQIDNALSIAHAQLADDYIALTKAYEEENARLDYILSIPEMRLFNRPLIDAARKQEATK